MLIKKYLKLVILILVTGSAFGQNDDKQAVILADKYYESYLETFPENAYFVDIPLTRHDQISSNNLAVLKTWERFEDSIYAEIKKIADKSLTEKKSKVAYWLLKEELESSKGMRVCKRNLWNVDHMNGWQLTWSQLADLQPVGTPEFRSQAITRWSKLPSFISTEIQNLRTGVSQGYTMPKEIVQLVIDQFQTLLAYKIEESPFYSPAKRDSDAVFKKEWTVLLTDKVLPALAGYQTFLINEYLTKARDDISILSIPNGSECYQACIRKMTTTNKTGGEIFELGKTIVNANKQTVEKLGIELYGISNFSDIIAHVNTDSANNFKSGTEIMEYDSALLIEAEKKCHAWFSLLPSTSVTIKPYAPYESGRGGYEEATMNKPAYFRINLNDATSQKKGQNEILTFHEAYPGHHVQIGIQKDIKDLPSISKLLWFGSYIEGWARYSEKLAEEMDLYKSKTALISRRAWPSRGMVVDPGIHLMHWTKQEAVDFMKESGMKESDALILYYRIIVWPAQLTSYDVGGEEIKSLRKLFEQRLGKAFDIRDFHTKILENGSIPLGALRSQVTDWLATKSK